jgi:hypothetical protein
MGKLEEIRQRLSTGSTPNQLISEGYAKSSVFAVNRKRKSQQQVTPVITTSIPEDLEELRHQKEIIKLQKEIVELEAAKEKIPERMAKMEDELQRLNGELSSLIGKCYASLYWVILNKHGGNEDEAHREALGAASDFLKHFGY